MENKQEPLEIERKYLIRYPDLAELDRICSKKVAMSQTYLKSEKGLSRRIRRGEEHGTVIYWYTEKEKISDTTRIEREQEISEEHYKKLLAEAIPNARTITKTRYYLPSGDLCFEVDIFPEWTDRAFVEVELEEENRVFVFPECLKIIREVTEDPRYTNVSLSLSGFPMDEIQEPPVS